jgi:Cys-tRNA(Pro)/Cys-tRNA(Cys) deacylase
MSAVALRANVWVVSARSTRATVAVQKAGVDFTVHEYAHDDATVAYGAEAVERLGLDPKRVFKTIVVLVKDKPAVAVVPVACEVDLKAVAIALGAKHATLASAADAQRVTGYVLGGISPIGQQRALPMFIDESAGDFATVFVSAGRRGLEIELAPDDLCTVAGATYAAIAAPSGGA